MIEYFTPTVVQQIISVEDLSPLEHLLLNQIFEATETAGTVYFYAKHGPRMSMTIQRKQLEAAIVASSDRPSSLLGLIEEQLAKAPADEGVFTLDLTATSYEFLLRDVVRRSAKLSYLSVVSSFTCSKMRPDGWGGMVAIITKDAILGKSTEEILEEFLVETGLEGAEVKHMPRTENARV